ncbi:MAG TPA: IS21-like element helper ATPase IstB [Gemmatimonadales bacterium]
MSRPDDQKTRASKLGLHGLIANWDEVKDRAWLDELLGYEEKERQRRSLERRVRNARLGRFKPMTDFDWAWPKKIDRELVEELFRFDFLAEAANVVLAGPNGIGKTMIAQNLAHQAVLRGHTVRFTTASELLNDLASQEAGSGLARRLRRYCHPELLVIDEVGYLSSTSKHADLLFEVVTRRYQHKSIVLTTNKAFKEWNEVFPSAGCVVTLIDRLVHRAEIIDLDGESYRAKEAMERAAQNAKKRSSRKKKGD